MLRNITNFCRKDCLFASFLARNNALQKLVASDRKWFSIAGEINRPGPVALSYWAFQPEAQTLSKVPVIILHGFLGSKQNWRGLGKAIAVKSQRKVYALDARNHGDSPHQDHFDYPLMAEDVKYFMSLQSIPEAVIIGHSMGGRTAMNLALSNENLINKLVIVDVSPLQVPPESFDSLDFMAAMIDALKSIPKMSIVQARKKIDIILSKTIHNEGVRQFLLTNLTEKNGNLCWKANLEVLLKNFNSGVPKFDVSGSFMKDTLFICGEKSPFVKPDEHPQIKTLFPKAEFVTIPGAGHWVHSEKPSEFLETLHNFL